MLANLNEVWRLTNERKITIGTFNIVNLESILAVLDTVERLNMPVILAFTQTHEENNIMNLNTIGLIVVLMAQHVKVPVVVHLDHSVSLDYIEKSLKMGFTSVIFDGSMLIYEEDIRQTKEVIALARKCGVSVEAEVGKMARITLSNEDVIEDRASDRRNYADLAEVKDLVEKTGMDCLACSFGTVHGEYFLEPKFDFDLVRELKEAAGVPIVMYEGSGISHANYKKIIANGARKTNYLTYMDKAEGGGVDTTSPVKYLRDAAKVGQDVIQKDTESAMRHSVNMDQGNLMKMKVTTFEINGYPGRAFVYDCGEQHTTRLEHVRAYNHVRENILEYLQEHTYHTVYTVEDGNTCHIYGKGFEAYLNANGVVGDRVILEADVVPNEASVFHILVNMKRQYDYILGVRSGTLDDLCRFISYKLSLSYEIAAIAPSVDGFTSVDAALATDNLKTTYDYHMPATVLGGLDVLADASLDMIKTGLGDIAGKYNCLVDWRTVYTANGEYYCQTIIDMAYKSIKEVVAHVNGVMTHGKAAARAVTEILVKTGITMEFAGSSRPTSGSEHHISRYWEMELLFARHAPIFHGTKMGLATPGVIATWKKLARDGIDFAACRKRVKALGKAAWEATVFDHFEVAAPGVLALEEKADKNDIEAVLKCIDIMEEKWPDIQAVIEQEPPQPEEVTAIPRSVEAPYRPMQADIDEAMARDGMILAREVCVCYDLLQLLWDLGLLEGYSAALVAYYWNSQR